MTTSVTKSVVAIALPLVLGVTMMIATEADAFDQRVGACPPAAINELTDVSSNIEPIAPKVDSDPTDDGAIIIECVVFAAPSVPENNFEHASPVGCAAVKCENSVALANGCAVEAVVGEKFSIAFFCSAGCYLNEIPANCSARV